MKPTTVQTRLALLILLAATPSLHAQDRTIPMTADYWEATDPSQVEFITHRSVPAARGLDGSAELSLKDVTFENGIIEFDVDLEQGGFVGLYFRGSDDRREREHFYIRAFWPVPPSRRTALQYTAIAGGVSLWDVTDDYQASASLRPEGWNHVKLVIAGRQLRAYVNDMTQPALHVPILEGTTAAGGLALHGAATFANVIVRPGVTEDLPTVAGYDPTAGDPRYLRDWRVTSPVDFPRGRTVVFYRFADDDPPSDLPDSSATWQPLRAGPRAFLNLTRAFGGANVGPRRLAWAKTTFTSDAAQERRLDLGFSDEVWIFINGQFLHASTNTYGTPGMKEPRGRAAIENLSVMLPLAEGENELLIGVANDFYGWGLIARLDDTEGIIMK